LLGIAVRVPAVCQVVGYACVEAIIGADNDVDKPVAKGLACCRIWVICHIEMGVSMEAVNISVMVCEKNQRIIAHDFTLVSASCSR